jgi:hypothetical protein
MLPRWATRIASIPSSRRLAWMLALALLLPLAQSIAARHLVAHHSAPVQRENAPVALLDAPCALCLIAAPLGGAAPADTQAPPFTAPGRHTLAPAPPVSLPASALALAYRSRAPPTPLL